MVLRGSFGTGSKHSLPIVNRECVLTDSHVIVIDEGLIIDPWFIREFCDFISNLIALIYLVSNWSICTSFWIDFVEVRII